MAEGGSKLPSGRSSGKVSHGLVAASFAGIMAVYSAGYARTRSAADSLEERAGRRAAIVREAPTATDQPARQSVDPDAAPAVGSQTAAAVPVAETHPKTESAGKAGPAKVETTGVVPAPAASPVTSAQTDAKAKTQTAAPVQVEPATVAANIAPKVVTPNTPVAPPASVATPAPNATPVSTVVSTAVTAPVAAPVATNAPASGSAPAPNPAPVVAAVAPAAPAPEPPKPASKWKDGVFTGWGYSRHGNIEAQVTIDGGRIKEAIISQCLTRYSCDVIDMLPPQVAKRQSPDVDTVSRATESADAFYYAVVDALKAAQK